MPVQIGAQPIEAPGIGHRGSHARRSEVIPVVECEIMLVVPAYGPLKALEVHFETALSYGRIDEVFPRPAAGVDAETREATLASPAAIIKPRSVIQNRVPHVADRNTVLVDVARVVPRGDVPECATEIQGSIREVDAE